MRAHYAEHLHGFRGKMLSKALRIAGWVVLGLSLAVVFAFIFAFLVRWLWNSLMPAIFGVKAITYWQAFGLIILVKLLFGGSSPHPRSPRRKRASHWRHKAAAWRCQPSDPDIADEEWQYYDQYWQEQGKVAFAAYLQAQKRREQRPDHSSSSADTPQ